MATIPTRDTLQNRMLPPIFDGPNWHEPWRPPARIPGVEYDALGRPITPTLQQPMDYVAYVERLGQHAPAGARQQADDIRRRPQAWTVAGGKPRRKKNDWFARNLPPPPFR